MYGLYTTPYNPQEYIGVELLDIGLDDFLDLTPKAKATKAEASGTISN